MPEIKLIDLRGGSARIALSVHALPEDDFQRQQMAYDSNTTPAQFRALISDRVFSVRYAVATSAWTPPSALTLMVVDAHPFVRAGLAHNPRTPDYALKVLIKDADPNVREVAQIAWADRRQAQANGPEWSV
jgi:hypothetical protein